MKKIIFLFLLSFVIFSEETVEVDSSKTLCDNLLSKTKEVVPVETTTSETNTVGQ